MQGFLRHLADAPPSQDDGYIVHGGQRVTNNNGLGRLSRGIAKLLVEPADNVDTNVSNATQ